MRRVVAVVSALLTLAACTTDPAPTQPSPSPAIHRDFTVMTTQIVTEADPAVARDAASEALVYNAFQRLMTADPGAGALKPDAASECAFRSARVYECVLKPNLRFNNSDELTASDVKFSIERAYRLAPTGGSARQLAALDRIQVVDDLTVRFHLRWPDRYFGFALAAPAASIVDEEIYDKDVTAGLHDPVAGSGPFEVAAVTDASITFTRRDGYTGAQPVALPVVVLAYAPDSGTIEQAMERGEVDAVWQGLSQAALTRLTDEIRASGGTTTSGFRQVELPDTLVQRLIWNPASGYRINASLRYAISDSLQPDRTLDSIVPRGTEGYAKAFAIGGAPTVKPPKGRRIVLSLSYASRNPGQRDLAARVRDRIEQGAGVSVRLVPDDRGADLWLSDQYATTNTPLAWLQPYLDDPLPGSADKLEELSERARGTNETEARAITLGEIQQQAAADAVVLPISQGSTWLFLGPGVTQTVPTFGPGWQLGLWSMRK